MTYLKGNPVNDFLVNRFDFDQIDFIELLADFDQGVLMTDDQGVLIFYNDVQAKIDNLDPADVLGKKITDVYEYNNDSSTCMRVLRHGHPIINYALSYRSKNADVGNTIHSVFPLRKNGKIIATICFVKDYNILERTIPSFLTPRNNDVFAEGTEYTFASIIGSAPEFVRAVKTAKMAANSPSPVMLFGETGTGKELFAQAIHNFYYSKRKKYIAVNCAAIPDSLIEGILFGTERGAYTGAVDKAGLFENANGGTIFLDEIDSMPLPLQGKLLRVLQERKVRRVGSLNTVNLSIKIISSVNSDPRELVRNGQFRMDLFYRLAVVFIAIPPLRKRKWDVEELARHFLLKYNMLLKKNLTYISPEVMELFWNYAWPGNVREMEHVIESAANMVRPGEDTLHLKHFHFANLMGDRDDRFSTTSLQPERPERPSASSETAGSTDYPGKTTDFSRTDPGPPEVRVPGTVFGHALNGRGLAQGKIDMEINTILTALDASGGNVARAARALRMSRQLLTYKIRSYGLRPRLERIKQEVFTLTGPLKQLR